MLVNKPKLIEVNQAAAKSKTHRVSVELDETVYQHAATEATSSDQTVEEWIADIVDMSTRP
jgi:hypothetical protein